MNGLRKEGLQIDKDERSYSTQIKTRKLNLRKIRKILIL